MNRNPIASSFLLLSLLALVFIPGGCKDDDNDGPYSGSRVVKVTDYDDGVVTDELIYEYEGDSVSRFLDINYETSDTMETTLDYYGDYISMITRPISSMYLGDYSKKVLMFTGGKMSASIQYHMSDNFIDYDEESMKEFMYSGDNLVDEIHYDYVSNAWEPYHRYIYAYIDGKASGTDIYYYEGGYWLQAAREEITYDGDLVDFVITSYGAGNVFTPYIKYDMIYEDSVLTSLEFLQWTGGGWASQEIIEFEYDSHGNIVVWRDIRPTETEEKRFAYESGEGNFNKIQDTFGTCVFFMVPWPTKSAGGFAAESRFPLPASMIE